MTRIHGKSNAATGATRAGGRCGTDLVGGRVAAHGARASGNVARDDRAQNIGGGDGDVALPARDVL